MHTYRPNKMDPKVLGLRSVHLLAKCNDTEIFVHKICQIGQTEAGTKRPGMVRHCSARTKGQVTLGWGIWGMTPIPPILCLRPCSKAPRESNRGKQEGAQAGIQDQGQDDHRNPSTAVAAPAAGPRQLGMGCSGHSEAGGPTPRHTSPTPHHPRPRLSRCWETCCSWSPDTWTVHSWR